ncbi:hypothetical protein MLD38_025575 [Melastoma candidum]|uniref:Uncharacterized protein n=1 Tax=Melastoma candidum TaxID=119954 RepID=A0ACB9NVG8_9MYRT|nr:hypothetical protein MLD38_025575 [Melastoma candidum]
MSNTPPTPAAIARSLLSPIGLQRDIALLQFQNEKLVQKSECQKIEHASLDGKLSKLQGKLIGYDSILEVVHSCWKDLADKVDLCSLRLKEASFHSLISPIDSEGSDQSLSRETFLSRLRDANANDSVSMACNDKETLLKRSVDMLSTVVFCIDDLWREKERLHSAILEAVPSDEASEKTTSNDLAVEQNKLRCSLSDLHVMHKLLSSELQNHRDINAKNKAESESLKAELESTITELEENKAKLSTLKAAKDSMKVTNFHVLNVGQKQLPSDKIKDRQRDLQYMESMFKELQDQGSSRLEELKFLHEERVKILRELTQSQNKLQNVQCLSSSQHCLALRDQLGKAKADLVHYQSLYEKLQTEKDDLYWREIELSINCDITDAYRRYSAVTDSRVSDLGTEIQKQIESRSLIEAKLQEALREPGRQEIISDFKALVSSFPEEMEAMQSHLSKYKETAINIHSLRADVRCHSDQLKRKVKQCESLHSRSSSQAADISKLRAKVRDVEETNIELKLILDMYKRECTDTRDSIEARDLEYKALAEVEILKSSLDEHSLESRVKCAIEAEAQSQQMLAAAEAEIAELRQKLEASKREMSQLKDALKSKNEENEAFLSEIESIGQEYDDMQTQNQHLLQQITERDDYNMKLVLEGLRAQQLRDSLLMDKRTIKKKIQLANASFEFIKMKDVKIDDQLKIYMEKVQKRAEERNQDSSALEISQKRLMDVRRLSDQVRVSLEDLTSKVEDSRGTFGELQVEMETERFNKKRLEEELEVVRTKASRLRAQVVNPVVERLQQELNEYKEILKCSICLDRRKEVVITKCYHLFCNSCIRRMIETRHRKCPVCSSSFGPNDVKPVYI